MQACAAILRSRNAFHLSVGRPEMSSDNLIVNVASGVFLGYKIQIDVSPLVCPCAHEDVFSSFPIVKPMPALVCLLASP